MSVDYQENENMHYGWRLNVWFRTWVFSARTARASSRVRRGQLPSRCLQGCFDRTEPLGMYLQIQVLYLLVSICIWYLCYHWGGPFLAVSKPMFASKYWITFAEYFQIYKIDTGLHRSKFKIQEISHLSFASVHIFFEMCVSQFSFRISDFVFRIRMSLDCCWCNLVGICTYGLFWAPQLWLDLFSQKTPRFLPARCNLDFPRCQDRTELGRSHKVRVGRVLQRRTSWRRTHLGRIFGEVPACRVVRS